MRALSIQPLFSECSLTTQHTVPSSCTPTPVTRAWLSPEEAGAEPLANHRRVGGSAGGSDCLPGDRVCPPPWRQPPLLNESVPMAPPCPDPVLHKCWPCVCDGTRGEAGDGVSTRRPWRRGQVCELRQVSRSLASVSTSAHWVLIDAPPHEVTVHKGNRRSELAEASTQRAGPGRSPRGPGPWCPAGTQHPLGHSLWNPPFKVTE